MALATITSTPSWTKTLQVGFLQRERIPLRTPLRSNSHLGLLIVALLDWVPCELGNKELENPTCVSLIAEQLGCVPTPTDVPGEEHTSRDTLVDEICGVE